MIEAVGGIFLAFMIVMIVDRHITHKRWIAETDKLHAYHQEEYDRFNAERQRFAEERAQLLDRIQAESYREYKTQEIRMEKAKNPQNFDDRPQYELL